MSRKGNCHTRLQKKRLKKKGRKAETPATNPKTNDLLFNSTPGRKSASLPTLTNEVIDGFVFSEEESKNDSDDDRTPVKSKEFVESMSAAPTSDLAFKRNRTSPEEIREYKKSRSGSDGSVKALKISQQ